LRIELEAVEKKIRSEDGDWDKKGKRLKAALRRASD
jgi:hypothetical protein